MKQLKIHIKIDKSKELLKTKQRKKKSENKQLKKILNILAITFIIL